MTERLWLRKPIHSALTFELVAFRVRGVSVAQIPAFYAELGRRGGGRRPAHNPSYSGNPWSLPQSPSATRTARLRAVGERVVPKIFSRLAPRAQAAIRQPLELLATDEAQTYCH